MVEIRECCVSTSLIPHLSAASVTSPHLIMPERHIDDMLLDNSTRPPEVQVINTDIYTTPMSDRGKPQVIIQNLGRTATKVCM